MARLSLTTPRLLTLAALLPLAGCASQARFEELSEQNKSLEARVQEVSAENDQLRSELDSTRARGSSASSTLDELRRENERLVTRVQASDEQLRRLDSLVNSLPIEALDSATDEALQRLAAANEGTIEYDRARGMLRFSSDLTFNSGSADVKSGASDALQDLAAVLNETGQLYELRIVGHTDSARISANTARRFPSNTHLSVARAIAVKESLVSAGVPAERMLVAGWGPHRPIAEAGRNGNTPANRRVEIFLSSSTEQEASANAAPGDTDDAASGSDGNSSPLPDVTK